jgi:hypothetical protein
MCHKDTKTQNINIIKFINIFKVHPENEFLNLVSSGT